MLHRVFSGDAEAKREYMLNKMEEGLKEDARIFYIVPEQITVSCEAVIAQRFDPSSCLKLETLNFSRLPNRVFRETGGLSFRPVNKTGRLLTLSQALRSLKGELKTLSADADRTAQITRLFGQLQEFSFYGVGPGKLEELSAEAAGRSRDLSDKLSDLGAVYRRYRELMDLSYDDSDAENQRLMSVLDKKDFFAGSLVFIDGFYDFTGDQYSIIKRMCSQAKDVWVGIFADGPSDEGGYAVRSAAAARKLAQSGEFDDVICKSAGRGSPELEHLRDHFFSDPAPFAGENKAIRAARCRSAWDEVRYAASRISELVREGYRYNQIAVAYRKDDSYEAACQSVFASYGIPCHGAVVKSASESSPARLIKLAVAICLGDGRLASFRRYMRTGLCGLDAREIFDLDDYARMWDLYGSGWMGEDRLSMPPRGYGSVMDDVQREELERINGLREKLTAPLKKLKSSLDTPKDRDKIRALCDFLGETGAQNRIFKKISGLRKEEKFAEADAVAAVWNAVLGALSQLDLTAGETESSPSEFFSELKLALSACESGTLPPAPDCVSVGEASFARNNGIKVLFILGVNAGIFPLEEKISGILSASDREFFADMNMELSPAPEDSALNEYFIFDQLIRTPSDRLFLTYRDRKSGTAGGSDKPSVFIEILKTLFAGFREEVFDPDSAMPVSKKDAFDYLCSHRGRGDPMTAFLEDYFADDPRMERIDGAPRFRDSAMDLKAPLRKGEKETVTSQTRLETYTKCRYMYFARYVLGLKTPPSALPGGAEEGTMVHSLLERFVRDLTESKTDPASVSDEFLDSEALRLCDEYQKSLGPISERDRGRMEYLKRTAAASLALVMKAMVREFSQSKFTPIMYEAKFGEDVEDYVIDLGPEGTLRFTGIIDRVDHYRSTDGKDYVRVIDYKTSTYTRFSLTDVYNGLNVQMLIYLFGLWNGGIKANGKRIDVLPAGVLYVPASAYKAKAEGDRDNVSLGDRITRDMKRTGLVLDDEEIKKAMEDGKFQLVLGKNSQNMLATLSEFGILKSHTEKRLKRLVKEMRRGMIAPDPFEGAPNACRYCDYRSVCKLESPPKKKYVTFEKDRKADIINAMKEETADE